MSEHLTDVKEVPSKGRATPRTDAAIRRWHLMELEVVPASITRELERELIQVLEDLRRYESGRVALLAEREHYKQRAAELSAELAIWKQCHSERAVKDLAELRPCYSIEGLTVFIAKHFPAMELRERCTEPDQLEGPCPNCNQWVVLKPSQPQCEQLEPWALVTDGCVVGIYIDQYTAGLHYEKLNGTPIHPGESAIARGSSKGLFLTLRQTNTLRRPTFSEVMSMCIHGTINRSKCGLEDCSIPPPGDSHGS